MLRTRSTCLAALLALAVPAGPAAAQFSIFGLSADLTMVIAPLARGNKAAVSVDIVAKDKKNKETMGTGHPEWTFKPETLIDVDSFANEFQPRLRASKSGTFSVFAKLDKIESNTITVILGEP